MKPMGTLAAFRNVATVTVLSVALVATVSAQAGYRYTQSDSNETNAVVSSGPVRLARISYIEGTANWRANDSVDFSAASPNIPLRQGAQLWVNSGSKLEVQFDDGSRMRLGSGAFASLQTLYSDSKGEFTEVKLNNGIASLTLTNKASMVQIDTPLISVKASEAGKIRLGVDKDVEISVRSGEAQVQGNQGTTTLNSGDYLDVTDSNGSYHVVKAPDSDSWDQFCDSRDNTFDRPSRYVPTNIGLVAGDLDSYGSWRPDPNYGHVWYPKALYPEWRPYHDGHWIWVSPFGWTWVADEPWGWAPYHYGTWVHASLGWGWCPGPRRQYWSPAVVSFSTYNNAVAWCPLAPTEVAYPSPVAAGVGVGGWWLGFSIGAAACYCPAGVDFCIAHPWNNLYVNHSAVSTLR